MQGYLYELKTDREVSLGAPHRYSLIRGRILKHVNVGAGNAAEKCIANDISHYQGTSDPKISDLYYTSSYTRA